MVQAPFAAQAAAGLCHSPGRNNQRRELPRRPVKIFNMRKARQQQARDECAEGEHNSTYERFLSQSKDSEGRHDSYNSRPLQLLRIPKLPWLPGNQFHLPERLDIRRAQHAALGDDGCYILRRCDVECWIANSNAMRR